jgi:hypothetical protein
MGGHGPCCFDREPHVHTVSAHIKGSPPQHNQLVRLAVPSHSEILWTKSAATRLSSIISRAADGHASPGHGLQAPERKR